MTTFELLSAIRQRINWLRARPDSTRARTDLALLLGDLRERIPA